MDHMPNHALHAPTNHDATPPSAPPPLPSTGPSTFFLLDHHPRNVHHPWRNAALVTVFQRDDADVKPPSVCLGMELSKM